MTSLALSAIAADSIAAPRNADHGKKGHAAPSAKTPIDDGSYFLSATNPIATLDQRDLEALSLRIFQMPVVLKARQTVASHWKTIVGRDMTAEALARFDEMVEEYAFNYVMKAVNSDANYPKVLSNIYGPPHEWFGMKVPGSRGGGGDGPDQSYALVPVDGYARFELVGKRLDPAVAEVTFTVTGNLSTTMTLSNLELSDLKIEADGSFVITLDPEPANGRSNHMQTKLEARWLFIRDCRADWRQLPNAYRIRRIDSPTAPEMTVDQIAERAARFMIDDVPAMYWWQRTFAVLDANAITPPFNTGALGGLVSQMISFARLKLADDEAYVVTLGSGGATFRNLVLHDFWFRTLDYWNRTSDMNNAQGIPNPDGSTTYVISIRDPGVHNWLDTAGLHELLVVHRWQGLARNLKPEDQPTAKGELVKLKDLDRVLPTGMKRVTTSERQQQLAERLETFKLRYVDH